MVVLVWLRFLRVVIQIQHFLNHTWQLAVSLAAGTRLNDSDLLIWRARKEFCCGDAMIAYPVDGCRSARKSELYHVSLLQL